MMIMAAYDSQENGVVLDGLTGQAVATRSGRIWRIPGHCAS